MAGSKKGRGKSSSSKRKKPRGRSGASARGRGSKKTPSRGRGSRRAGFLGTLRGLFRLRWLVLAAILAGVFVFVFDVDTVDSPAMSPGVEPGDVILIDRLAAEFASPDPGDVVFIRNPDDRERELMVRVVAVENDLVAAAPHGQVWVNGEAVVRDDPSDAWRASDEVAMASNRDTLPAELSNGAEHRVLVRDDALTRVAGDEEVEVPAGHLYVVGDNRSRAYDSRSFGPVPVADVVGRVRVVLRANDPERGLLGRYVRLP